MNAATEPCCDYCGLLGWTVEKYGRVTHKQGCPHRTDPWHQGDPDPAAATERRVEFFWQLCDPDAEIGTTFREGSGFDELVGALRDLCAVEAEQTPEGFIPSGNIHLYWSRVDRR